MENKMTRAKIEQFHARLIEDEKSKSTIEKYLRDVESFFNFVGDEAVTKEIVVQYKEHLKRNYKPSSVNSMLASINRFFREMGWFKCIVKTLKIQRETFRNQERELNKNEYFRLLETAKKRKNIRLYLLMQTLCATGIRVSELPFITVEAIWSGRAVVSLKGKTRTVLIPSALRRKLSSYVRNKGQKSGSIFVTKSGRPMDRSNILHEMKALCGEAGVDRKKVFPHNLRHLFACLFYQKEKDLSRLADLLGHSNVNTTRIYTCVSGDEQERQIEELGLVVGTKEKPHNRHYAVPIF
ncbi:MAG: tyrosine-type recombinase/integrase [Eubacteriales bacterium]|nr:tyrosine-type recombinase/integrase [Eubacteriales bacterium]